MHGTEHFRKRLLLEIKPPDGRNERRCNGVL